MYFETVEEPLVPHIGDIRSGELKVWSGAGGVLDRCKSASRPLNVGGEEREGAWRIFGQGCDISLLGGNSEVEKERDAFQHFSSYSEMDYQHHFLDVKLEPQYQASNNLTVTSSLSSTVEYSLPWKSLNSPHKELQLFGAGDVASQAARDTSEKCHDSKAELCSSTNMYQRKRCGEEIIVLDEETYSPTVATAGQEGNPIILDEEFDVSEKMTRGDYQEEPILLDDDTDEEFGWEEEDATEDVKVPISYLDGIMDSPEIGCVAGLESLPLRQFKRSITSCKVEEEHLSAGPSAMMDHGLVTSEACQWIDSKRIRTSYQQDCCPSGLLDSTGQGRTNESKSCNGNVPEDQPNASETCGETRPHLQSEPLINGNSSNKEMTTEERTAFQELVQFLSDVQARGEVFVQGSSNPSDFAVQSSWSKPELTEQSTAKGAVDVIVYEPEPLGSWPEQSSDVVVEVKKETDQISEPVREVGLGPCIRYRKLVYAALRTFEQVRQQVIKDPSYGQASPNAEVSNKRLRADLKAACLMRKRGFWLNDKVRPIGDVPGVAVGDRFRYRIEMAVIGLHRAVQAGIAVIPARFNSFGVSVASSVVIGVSDPYGDDNDMGDTVVYSGQGGLCCRTKESQDQQLKRGNLALHNSHQLGLPVRLIRGHKDQHLMSGIAYSYDGLYKVNEMHYVTGVNGKLVYKFVMERLAGQRPVSHGSENPSGVVPLLASPSALARNELDWAQASDEKTLYLEKGQANE